jgi:hypothetical protein
MLLQYDDTNATTTVRLTMLLPGSTVRRYQCSYAGVAVVKWDPSKNALKINQKRFTPIVITTDWLQLLHLKKTQTGSKKKGQLQEKWTHSWGSIVTNSILVFLCTSDAFECVTYHDLRFYVFLRNCVGLYRSSRTNQIQNSARLKRGHNGNVAGRSERARLFAGRWNQKRLSFFFRIPMMSRKRHLNDI